MQCTCFVSNVVSGISAKTNKPYAYQPLQIMQQPVATDVFDTYFLKDGVEPLAPGKYTADFHLVNAREGNGKNLRFSNFKPA